MATTASGHLEADEEEGAAGVDPECQPLLPHLTPRLRTFTLSDDDVKDTMTYNAETLTGWSVFALNSGYGKTAWSRPSAWLMLLRLMCLSMLVAVLVLALVPDPAQMKTSKFQKISVFLRIFVGLLLGFFLTSSVNRWFQCTDGFLELFDAIRNLQMQLLALGVPKDLRFKCVRFGVISGWLLSRRLRLNGPEEEKEATLEHMWNELVDGDGQEEPIPGEDCETKKFIALSRAEADMLKTCDDPAGMVWIWVASLVGRMSQDGWIPPMASPTYGRIMNLVQTAHGGIRTVKLSITVQAPFIYVHMLASLVHVNNILNAISFGIVMGSTVGTGLQFHAAKEMVGNGTAYNHQSKESEVIADIENFAISFVICVVGPFLYQVLLEVSVCLAQPFSSPEGHIPTERLLQGLQRDLSDAVRMGKHPPSWKAPFLKAPPPPKAEASPASPHGQP